MLSNRGQSAIEYMLMIVLILTILLMVLIWSQNTSVGIAETGENDTTQVRCATTNCTSYADCTSICGSGATCDDYYGKCRMP